MKYAPPDITDPARIAHQLNKLAGLRLRIVRRAADMLVLHFGDVRAVRGGTVGMFALHVQCPWRIEGPNGIVRGYFDVWQEDDDALHPLLEMTRHAVVQAAMMDYGGAVVTFDGNDRLVLFPAAAHGEHWRLFQPGTKRRHFVVEGSRLSRR